MLRWLSIILVCAAPLAAEKYTGPRPPKPDLPYIMHADSLLPTESAEAREDNRKNEVTYVVPGANSSARTPLSSPAFLVQADQLQPDHLHLYKLVSRNGQREVLFSRKNKRLARPIRLNVTRLDEGLFKVEVDEILENGEYSLTPEGSNQVFCFQVY